MTTHAGRVSTPRHIPAGAPASGDGIVVGTGTVVIDVYVDFLCPFCRQFEETAGPTLHRLVDDGLVSIVYHPMAFLDQLSADHYSSRASAASGCAADGGLFVEYAEALFANQPPEGGPGLTDDELIEIGGLVGLDPPFAGCVRDRTYLDWAAYVTDKAMERGVSGTPTVLVEDVPVPANVRSITQAVAAAR
ncbi:DsbA family protein [Microbispora sp. ATCC PTA-5024]|uniref:DsbA family protein n=1 Tax=Microbispora sp. ATCC PTA-5024 TaxID=316330 RepID=UPI0003DCFB03|nr:thioredoxin domain-containing protein [Microbispora sp. ATCC PTA-5024]ETK35673.1 protein-disulfide isomerase [Microbispora sp. ATCC PTA-5024]